MTGIYITLVSGLIQIFGWEMLLLAAAVDPVRFGRLTHRYASWIQQHVEALAAADVPVVMIHDDIVWSSGPFLSPAWYREFVFPNYRRMVAPLRDSGKKVLYTSDGNCSAFIDDVAACGVHGFVLEPWTDMAALAEKYGRTHVFIGNADTRILLSGTKVEIRAEVERCMAIGKSCPGFFMAVGNHIPANTPVESCLYYNQVYEELSKR
jgi:uroporphyrinogen-III decarboxylase